MLELELKLGLKMKPEHEGWDDAHSDWTVVDG
jgi:hypothetical protein